MANKLADTMRHLIKIANFFKIRNVFRGWIQHKGWLTL